jgi:two-component system, sensor histidine kinase and response regulator
MADLGKILLVDDSRDDAELLMGALTRVGHKLQFEQVETAETMLAALRRDHWDIVISDYSMPHFNGLEALNLLKSLNLDIPFILVSRITGEEMAVEAMKAGAQDYLLKSHVDQLPLAVERALHEAQVRRERRDAEARYRSLFESVPVGVFGTTPEGQILRANPTFVKMLGFRDVAQLQHLKPGALWLNAEDFARRNAILLREGVIRDYDSHLRRADGSTFWCAESLIAEYDPVSGRVTEFDGVAVEITDRKRVQQELAQARDAALETARLKSEFLANMSHEIRTPLNGIVGMSELLRDSELSSDQREFADLIGSSADALLIIVNDILDFSKISAGKLVFEEIDFELATVIETVVSTLLVKRAEKKGLELILALDPKVPSFVRGDPVRLRQVLTNLLGNAIKFTERGEVVVSISLADVTDREVSLQFQVTDTGIGISAVAQRELFQPFHQADGSTTRVFGGTGLGLAISAQLVKLMGGKIELESELGKGSRFFFNLTFLRSKSDAATSTKYQTLSGLRVLVVDDNKTNRQIVERQIASWGIDSASVSSGSEALVALRESATDSPFDIAILDLAMPGMDGLMLAQLIKTEPAIANTRLLMMSSLGSRGDADAASVPIEAWLTKPVKRSQLYDSLAGLMTTEVAVVKPPADATRPEHPLTVKRRRFRILVAEDNLINHAVVTHQLRTLGYPADVVANGAEAVAAFAGGQYQLVLMDCMMPDMDGFEATGELRRREAETGQHTTIVAMTANALEGDREKCLAAGMDDYLSKPVNMKELAKMLDRWLIEDPAPASFSDQRRITHRF